MARAHSAASRQFIFVTPRLNGPALDGSDVGTVLPSEYAGHRLQGRCRRRHERQLIRIRMTAFCTVDRPIWVGSGRPCPLRAAPSSDRPLPAQNQSLGLGPRVSLKRTLVAAK